jgi:twitching motility protein PilT
LEAVVSQRLLPRADGRGRVAAVEVMIATPLIRDLILDETRTGGIREAIADGRVQYGMQTFDQHLMELVHEGLVAYDVAVAASTRPADFDLQMRTLSGSDNDLLAGMARTEEKAGATAGADSDLMIGSNLFDP